MAQQTGKTIASTEQAPQGEHGVFPPFDSQTYPSQLLWLTLTFVALYLLMSRIALPRIASILEQRRKHVAETHRKDADAKLEMRVAEAEKAIAAARSAAMTNVHGIAEEAARAIVERLIGRAPANEDVSEAVRDVLKG